METFGKMLMRNLADHDTAYHFPGVQIDFEERRRPADWTAFDHDGAVIQYRGDMNDTENYALSFRGEMLPFDESNDALESEEQIIAVYEYPVRKLNEAFWNGCVEESLLRPVWKADTKQIESRIAKLRDQIAELQREREHYESLLPKQRKAGMA